MLAYRWKCSSCFNVVQFGIKQEAPTHCRKCGEQDFFNDDDNAPVYLFKTETNMNFENDPVNHPSHYNTGNIEVIDFIKDKLTPELFEGYCIGNVLKYVSRYKHKNGVQDLEKAAVYLKWAINCLKGEELEK